MRTLLFFVLFISSVFAQVEYSKRGDTSGLLPRFFIDIASYASQDSNKSKIDVFVKIPYSNIQFLKTTAGYSARYAVTVSLYEQEDDKLILEKLWNEKVNTQNFNQTASTNSYNVSYKSFTLEPGDYKFVCKVEDLESKKNYAFDQKIHLREFSKELDLSDIILVSEFIETQEGLKIIPNIANLVTSNDTMLSFFYELYFNTDTTLNVSYVIKGKEGEAFYIKDKKIDVTKGRNEIHESLENIKIALGDYQLDVKVKDVNDKMIKGIGKKFSSKIFGFPAIIRDLDEAILQMQFIASSTELNELKDGASYEEKLENYQKFWKRIDPSPNTIENETLNEYYRRVEYANNNFDGYFKGWRSDMGMVYITLGPPDQVIRRPYEIDSKPYEVWEYYVINRSFLFIDQTNFGDYRLENPAYGDWFRYRP